MIHLNIMNGKLKTSFKELKNELQQLVGHELSLLQVDDNSNISGYIEIGNNDTFNESDILSIIAKHSVYFKIEVKEDDFNRNQLFSDFIWDNRILIQLYKNKFGSVYEIEDCSWILEK